MSESQQDKAPRAGNEATMGEAVGGLRELSLTDEQGHATAAEDHSDGKFKAEHEEIDSDVVLDEAEVNTAIQMGVGKKKEKRKPKSKKTKKAGTGFEEYFVDAPITPAEHDEEKSLYHPTISFAQRIETAVQRFSAKRNMDSLRKDIFDKYLRSGGVNAGQKMFSGGLDSTTLEEKDAEGIAQLTATSFIPEDRVHPDNEKFVVDFEGCIKEFFSHVVPLYFDLGKDLDYGSPQQIKLIVGTITNFLNYLVYHDVCPEYQDQIQASKALCMTAESELWAMELAKTRLPGDFNRACSQIFGGLFEADSKMVESEYWMPTASGKESTSLSPSLAPKVFKIGLVATADSATFSEYQKQVKSRSIRVVSSEVVPLEVTEIIFSSEESKILYEREEASGIKPIGMLKAKSWQTPFSIAEDLTPEQEASAASEQRSSKEYVFWAEDDLLDQLSVGMKFEAMVKELSVGITYFDAVYGIYVSFFSLSNNEIMSSWREIETEWLPMRKVEGGSLDDDEEFGDDIDNALTAPRTVLEQTVMA